MTHYLGGLLSCHAWVKSRHYFIAVLKLLIRQGLLRLQPKNVLEKWMWITTNSNSYVYFLNVTEWQRLLLHRHLFVETLFLLPIRLADLRNPTWPCQGYDYWKRKSTRALHWFHPTSVLGHRHKQYWVHLYGYFYWLSYFRFTSACLWKVTSASNMSASLHHHKHDAT